MSDSIQAKATDGTWINLATLLEPIGAYYMSESNISPANTLGGTWTYIGYKDWGPNPVNLGSTVNPPIAGTVVRHFGVVHYSINGQGPTIAGWANSIMEFEDGDLPHAIDVGANNGFLQAQNSAYGTVWSRVTANNTLEISNKSQSQIGTWYYGGIVYHTDDDLPESLPGGLHVWKRTA